MTAPPYLVIAQTTSSGGGGERVRGAGIGTNDCGAGQVTGSARENDSMGNQHAMAVRGESAPASMNAQHAGVVDLMLRGNLNGLSDEQIMQVYLARCDAMGVDARTQPFDVLNLRGTKILYPNARLADQLIGQRGLSVEVIDETTSGDLYRVRVKVSDGVRSVNASAALPVKGLAGEALGNAWMKCETKAVRRGVLRFCGLGALPEPGLEEERRKHGLRVVHAMGADRGLKHEQIRAIAQEHYAIESMTELDADDLAELSDAIEAQIALAGGEPDPSWMAEGLIDTDDDLIDVDRDTGEILDGDAEPIGLANPDVLAAWQPVIDAANSLDELAEVQQGIKDAGIKSADHPELLRAFKGRENTLKLAAAKRNRAAQDASERAKHAANAA